MKFEIAVLPGDGVGPEVVEQGLAVLDAVGRRFDHEFLLCFGDIGGVAIDNHGTALPGDVLATCRRCRAVLLGAVGGPKWDDPQARVRPEDGLLGLRKGMGVYANLRPVKVFSLLANSTSLKPEVITGVDMVVVRELTGGLYFGKPKKRWQTARGQRVVDTLAYSEMEIERILRVGFELARSRKRKLTSVDKANVLESSRLWREIAVGLAPEYPDVELQHILVDACAMRLIQQPAQFDVIVTENMFGDILTDEASMLAGSMGMLPSASLAGAPGVGGRAIKGLYEPIHGSAPSRAGQDMANPIATILSLALMLRYSLGLEEAAGAVEEAVDRTLDNGHRTYDIMEPGMNQVGTRGMGELVAEGVRGGK